MTIALQPTVTLVNDTAVTTSRDVANFFHKQHQHVTQKIKGLDCSDEFLSSNFSLVKFEHRGNEYSEYQITKDGFVFLAMGFTGKKAAAFKEAYINEFNRMEAELRGENSLPATVIPEANAEASHREDRLLGIIETMVSREPQTQQAPALPAPRDLSSMIAAMNYDGIMIIVPWDQVETRTPELARIPQVQAWMRQH